MNKRVDNKNDNYFCHGVCITSQDDLSSRFHYPFVWKKNRGKISYRSLSWRHSSSLGSLESWFDVTILCWKYTHIQLQTRRHIKKKRSGKKWFQEWVMVPQEEDPQEDMKKESEEKRRRKRHRRCKELASTRSQKRGKKKRYTDILNPEDYWKDAQE